ARCGTARTLFYSLFDRTLGGWRLQAYEGPLSGVQVKDFMKDDEGKREEGLKWFSRPDQIPNERFEQAKAMGAKRSPAELHAALSVIGPIRTRIAPMHGDLHAENVRVR